MQKGLFDAIKENPNFPYCRRILDIYWQWLLKRSFGYSGALLGNSLPENIRAIRESSFNMTRGLGWGG